METQDILFVTLAVAIVVATFFWVWLLWYIIKIFRSVHELIGDFRQRLVAIDDILRTIHEKLASTHAQLSLLSEGIKQLITFFINRRTKRRSSPRASSATDDF